MQPHASTNTNTSKPSQQNVKTSQQTEGRQSTDNRNQNKTQTVQGKEASSTTNAQNTQGRQSQASSEQSNAKTGDSRMGDNDRTIPLPERVEPVAGKRSSAN